LYVLLILPGIGKDMAIIILGALNSKKRNEANSFLFLRLLKKIAIINGEFVRTLRDFHWRRKKIQPISYI